MRFFVWCVLLDDGKGDGGHTQTKKKFRKNFRKFFFRFFFKIIFFPLKVFLLTLFFLRILYRIYLFISLCCFFCWSNNEISQKKYTTHHTHHRTNFFSKKKFFENRLLRWIIGPFWSKRNRFSSIQSKDTSSTLYSFPVRHIAVENVFLDNIRTTRLSGTAHGGGGLNLDKYRTTRRHMAV